MRVTYFDTSDVVDDGTVESVDSVVSSITDQSTVLVDKDDQTDGNQNQDSDRRKELRNLLYTVPQAKHFRENQVEKWLDLMQNDPRAEWHINRLTGIGGSEIGVLVAGLRGEPDAFGDTGHSLVLEKSLIFMPKKQTLAMRKGIFLENGIRQFFLEDYNGTQDHEAIAAFNSKDRLRPWMRYSPDDVVMIGNKRYLTDYKHPNEATNHGDVYLRYVCQLHMGAMVAQHAGIEINGMLLVQYPEDGADNLVVTKIPFDNSIARDIITAGDEAWSHILNGTNYVRDDIVDDIALNEEQQDLMIKYSTEFTRYNIAAKVMTEKADAAKKKIINLLNTNPAANDAKVFGAGVDISIKKASVDFDLLARQIGDDAAKLPVIDAKALLKKQIEKNVDLSEYETGKFVWDEDRMLKQAEELGINLKSVLTNNYRFTAKVSDDFKDDVVLLMGGVVDKLPTPAVPVAKVKAKAKTEAKM